VVIKTKNQERVFRFSTLLQIKNRHISGGLQQGQPYALGLLSSRCPILTAVIEVLPHCRFDIQFLSKTRKPCGNKA
jgi:hypothetical protein